MHTIILFGFKGSGKTYFGRLLAKKLAVAFIDIDEEVQKRYEAQFQETLTIKEMVLKKGEAFFRSLETEVVFQLKSGLPQVLALGGGTLLNPKHADHLKTIGQLIYLKADLATLRNRILAGPIPSFFDLQDLEGSFQKMIAARLPSYLAVGAPSIDLHDKTDHAILEELVKLALY